MTVWAKKTLGRGGWHSVQDRVAQLQMSLLAPHDLMMLSSSLDMDRDVVFLGLPDRSLLDVFDGFEEIERSDLPEGLSVLVCREDGFNERFPDITKKIGPKPR